MVATLLILISIVFLYLWADAAWRQRHTYISYAAAKTRLEYRYTQKISLQSKLGLEEAFREHHDRMCKKTEKLHAELLAAKEHLSKRCKWSPIRNTLFDKHVFAYEIAMSRFLAAEAEGPLTISIRPDWPRFLDH
jgi:hypothetical protein